MKKKGNIRQGQIKKSASQKSPAAKNENPRNSYSNLIGIIIIILLGIIVYSNSFNCSFHFDDIGNIVENTKIHNLSDVKAWWNFVPTRPIGNLTFALNYHFNKLDVRYYHLVNLIIHLINACLVGWLTLLIFSSPAMRDHKISRHKKVLALFMALLFVSHPLATQSVTYIVQRLASLATLFYMLSLALYVKARLTEKGSKVKYILFAGAFLSALTAMFTKEISFTLPFAILLYEFFFLRTKKLSVNFKDYRIILLIIAIVSIIIVIPLQFSYNVFKPIPPEQGHTYTVTSYNYLLTQFSVIVKYIQLLFLPINQMLDYDFPISNNFFGLRTILSFLLLVSLIILAIFLFKKQRMISFGIFWFFLTLSVEASIIPIPNLIFEHRTYLPSFGFFLILSTTVFVILWPKYKSIASGILVIIIASNSYLTYERNKVWKDDVTLWNDNIRKAPNKARPYLTLAWWYVQEKQWDKALADYTQAIAINPKYAETYYDRSYVYGYLNSFDKAIADLSKAIELNPKFSAAYYNRGNQYKNLNQYNKAIADYSKAITFDSNYADAYCNRGITYSILKEWDKALADISKAIFIKPDNAYYTFNRGTIYGSLSQWDKAIADYTSAIVINPNHKEAYVNRAIAYCNLNQWDKAINDFNSALEIDPTFSSALTNRELAYKKLQSEKSK
jgi:tetratricopeptide (TPR) repeat protein